MEERIRQLEARVSELEKLAMRLQAYRNAALWAAGILATFGVWQQLSVSGVSREIAKVKTQAAEAKLDADAAGRQLGAIKPLIDSFPEQARRVLTETAPGVIEEALGPQSARFVHYGDRVGLRVSRRVGDAFLGVSDGVGAADTGDLQHPRELGPHETFTLVSVDDQQRPSQRGAGSPSE